ncbi:MAG TPA: HEAT repeat domain-containing protein [Dongiaceae bacterium]|nr:HEAT repeat domain-containing protein [Dongiaceae bacterium]
MMTNTTENLGNAGTAGWPRTGRVGGELASLLSAAFTAGAGCYREAQAVGVFVSSTPGRAAGLVDLHVLLFPRLQPPTVHPGGAQVDALWVEVCLRGLRHPQPYVRASACQRLGQLGHAEAGGPLREAARWDSDECVREVAVAALENLVIEHVPADALAGIELLLVSRAPGGWSVLARGRTDPRGYTRFAGVPEDSLCSLQLASVGLGGLADSTVGRWAATPGYEPLAFDEASLTTGRIGDYSVEISPSLNQAGTFDAVLRVSGGPGTGAVPLNAPFRPLARRGFHLYHPRITSGDQTTATFERLPVGKYDLLWPVRTPALEHESALSAKSEGPARAPRPNLDACLQLVVHPADRRVLATVEPDHGGRVVLTVATDSLELGAARVKYSLLGENGEIHLDSVAGTGVFRGCRYLRQSFAPEAAFALSLEVLT